MIRSSATHLIEDTLEFERTEIGMVDVGHQGLTHTVDQGLEAAAGEGFGNYFRSAFPSDMACFNWCCCGDQTTQGIKVAFKEQICLSP